jgi:hypothetical protein
MVIILKPLFVALIVSISLFQGSDVFSQQKDINSYYLEVYLGERPSKIYSGPIAPEILYRQSLGELSFLDDYFNENFARPLIVDELFLLTDYWFSDMMVASSCPNQYLSQNIQYIRYLFRLLSVSYLFEGLKQHHLLLHSLGFDRNACPLSWHQLFSSCRPQTEDMSRFVQRAQFRHLRDLNQSDYSRLTDEAQKEWMKSLHSEARLGQSDNVSRQRILSWCQGNKVDCKNIKLEEVQTALASSCESDQKFIQMICSEHDSLFGVSDQSLMVDLLLKSNIMNVLNDGGYGKSCIQRYVNLFRHREQSYAPLVSSVPIIYSQLQEKNVPYLQGSLFVPGALKEFDLRGLDNFLFVEKRVSEVDEEPEVIEEVVVSIEPPIKEVIEEEVAPPPVIIVQEPLPEVVKRSAFAEAFDKLQETKAAKVKVDMKAFEGDFLFTDRMKQSLAEPLKDYQTREALTDMFTYDLLGTKVEPFRLMFLKFLIDSQMHQGLFNITSVIGHQFYVLNDIDQEGQAVAIEISNNEETQYQWQITLIQEEKITNAKILEQH